MTFRYKLLIASALTMVAAVGAVAWTVTVNTRRAFERIDDQRTDALVGQFRREFDRRGEEIARRINAIADSEAVRKLALETDYAPFYNEAQDLAAANSLDFLELIASDGSIISSAQWPARYGYKEEWIPRNSFPPNAFLKREELAADPALALMAVHAINVSDKRVFVVGGQRIDDAFLSSLVLPSGTRAVLYRNLDAGPVKQTDKFGPIIEQVRRDSKESKIIAANETVHAIPLIGASLENGPPPLLGVLAIATSRQELLSLENFILRLGATVGAAGILFGIMLSAWASVRITRPVKRLVAGARAVADGNWNAHVDVHSSDEIGQLADAFNDMTRQLIEQRDKLMQAERVASWRELARRLAHELKNPLFPLQITIENLQRARERDPAQFDEVFRESTTTLLAELANLKTIVGSFSDFSKMPPPQLEPVNVNELVRQVTRLFAAQLEDPRRPPISPRMEFDETLPPVFADPDQLSRALRNLVLNAMDAMPRGGQLTVRTSRVNGNARLEVSDTGEGLTPEECERLFTPYYTTKQHGTGLGLAIVQSVVSDHGGRISVDSEKGRGTTFRIDLPLAKREGNL